MNKQEAVKKAAARRGMKVSDGKSKIAEFMDSVVEARNKAFGRETVTIKEAPAEGGEAQEVLENGK